MIVAGLEFVLYGVKQEPGHSVIHLAIGITDSVGCLTITFSRHDENNNGRGASSFQGYGNNILDRARGRVRGRSRGRGRRKKLHLCLFNLGFFTGSKE